MLKVFLFILPLFINTSRCINRVALDISKNDDKNFKVETTSVDGITTNYIVPNEGVFTTAVYHGNDVIWERIYDKQTLNYVRFITGPEGTMVISSSAPGDIKLLDYYNFTQEKWIKFKTFNSKEEKEKKLKEYLQKKELGMKIEFEEESFTSADFQELDQSHTSNKEHESSSSGESNQQSKDLENLGEHPKFLEEVELESVKFEEDFEKDIDQKKEDDPKLDDDKDKSEQVDQVSKKSKDSSPKQNVLRDIDVLTKFQELVSEEKEGPDHKTKAKICKKSNDPEDDDGEASFKTCSEFPLQTIECDECNLHEESQVCLIGNKDRWPSQDEPQHEDESDKNENIKGLNCLDSEKSNYLGTQSLDVGGKFVEAGDSISDILDAMTDDDDGGEIDSILIGGPESDESRRQSTFEPPKNEEGYMGFSKFDEVKLISQLVPDGKFGFKLKKTVNVDTEGKNSIDTVNTAGQSGKEEEDTDDKEEEKEQEEQEKQLKKSGPLRFIKKDKLKKKPSRRFGELKLGYVSSLRIRSDYRLRTNSQDNSSQIKTESKDSSSQSLMRQSKSVPKSPVRGHSESDLSVLLREKRPLDEFRQKSESDIRKPDILPPGSQSAPSTLQRSKKKFNGRIPLVGRSSSSLSKDHNKKSKIKNQSSFLTYLVETGLKKSTKEIHKPKIKTESIKQQKKDLESKDYQELDPKEPQTEQSTEDDKTTDSGDSYDQLVSDNVSENNEEKEQFTTKSEVIEESKEGIETKTEITETTEFTECGIYDLPKSSEQSKEIMDEEQKDKEDPTNPYDKALFDIIGARPKTNTSFKIKYKRSHSSGKFKIPKIVVQDPEGDVVDPQIDKPKKKERKKKDVKKSEFDPPDVSANDEFIIKNPLRRFSSKDKTKKDEKDKKEDDKKDDGVDPNEKCKPTKTNVKWDDEDDNDRIARREEISKKYLKPSSSCCIIS